MVPAENMSPGNVRAARKACKDKTKSSLFKEFAKSSGTQFVFIPKLQISRMQVMFKGAQIFATNFDAATFLADSKGYERQRKF